MTAASWVSPVTTALGVIVLLALLVVLIAMEASRHRSGRPAPARTVGTTVVLGAVLAVDIVARFALLAHGH